MVAGVVAVVEVEVAEVRECSWKDPQPLRRAAASENAGSELEALRDELEATRTAAEESAPGPVGPSQLAELRIRTVGEG